MSTTYYAATVVTGPTKADVLYDMRAVEDEAHLVDRTTQDTLSEDVANADAQNKAWDSCRCARSPCCEGAFGVRYSHANRSRN